MSKPDDPKFPEENCAPISLRTAKLTPYQGKKRCYGHFKCEKCEKTWGSAFSWANGWQKCKDCNIKVYPHKQNRLRRSKRENLERKSHREDLCEKCLELGRPCAQYDYPEKS